MKNISTQALQTYKTLLKYSQLVLNHQIHFRNVNISDESHMHQIYTSKGESTQKPHLVLLHGFAGSAMSYIRTFHSLSEHFHVHALDHFGNGFSTRPLYNENQNQKQILNLYVDSIEKWRKQIGLDNFVLAGHSFGGYIGALYTQQFNSIVDRLILLSPVGTSKPEQIHLQIQSRKAESIKNKISLFLIQKLYELKLQPSKIFSTPVLGDLLVKMFLKSTIELQKQQKQMWGQYIKYISEQESHVQRSFYQCFDWPFISKLKSISQVLESIVQKDNLKPIEFYYGQNDWTESIGAKNLHVKHKNICCEIIPKATHNMIFDYPHQVTHRIINPPLSKKQLLV